MLWAYFAFSQYLIIWSGNLPEEIPWYLRRLEHGWALMAVIIAILQFALPFLLLLSRDLKRSAGALGVLAAVIVCVRFADLFWLVVPEFERAGIRIHWMDVVAPIGLGGVWLAVFRAHLERKPLLPAGLPHGAH